MRTIKELPVPQDGNDVEFPDGQIRNETDSVTGTPVVREIYGDILTNIYKIIRDAGIDFTQDEDGENSQYQFLDALKVFVNNLNDKQQILTVDNEDINLPINIDNLPNSYVFIGQISDSLTATTNYTINSGDSGTASYPVVLAQNIAASATVLVVINSAGTRIVSLSGNAETTDNNGLFVGLGNPLSFNDSETLLYYSKGYIIDETPNSFAIEQAIQASEGTSDIIVVQCIVHRDKLIALALNTSTTTYDAFAFDLGDLSTVEGKIAMPKTSGTDHQPYMYCDGAFVYFSNSGTTIQSVNDSANDNDFAKFSFDAGALSFSLVSSFSLNVAFIKTTNVFMNSANERLYTFLNGTLIYFTFDGSAPTQVGFFDTVNGLVFHFFKSTYYSNGETASKWNF